MKLIKSIQVNYDLISQDIDLTKSESEIISKRCKAIGKACLKNEMRRRLRPRIAESNNIAIKDIPFYSIKIKFIY